ncbi:MAG: hypothetical protein U0271_25025 [Polyangiaceae bacterium]
MTLELARRLLAAGAISPRDVEAALYLSVVRGVSTARALVDRGVLSERALEEELNRRRGLPLRQVNPQPELVSQLPRGMCRMLAAVPLRHDPITGSIEVAAVDPTDMHVAREFSFHLGAPVRVQRATMAAIEEAIRRLELAEGMPTSRSRRQTPAFPHGAPESVPPSPPPPSPPPQAEEVPIPLVRRISSPQAPEGLVAPNNPLDFDDEPPLPDEPVPRSRRLALEDTATHQPAVSFPSNLPPPPPEPVAIAPLADPSAPPSVRLRPASGIHEALTEATEPVEPSPPRLLLDTTNSDVTSAPPEPMMEAPTLAEPASAPPFLDSPPPPPRRERQPTLELDPDPIPRAPDAGWSPTLPELLNLMSRARSRDVILDLALRAITLVAQRAALFVVRKEGFQGWQCNPAFGSEESLRDILIPSQQPSIFATAAAAGFYLGPIPQTSVHRPLLGLLGRSTPDVAVYVARVRGRPTLLLIADELDDTLLGTKALGEISKRAGEALTSLLAMR